MLRRDIETKPENACPTQAYPMHHGKYTTAEKTADDAKKKKNQEQWKQEMERDRERMRKNLEAAKKGAMKLT